MKYYILAVAFSFSLVTGCKAKKNIESSNTNASTKKESTTVRTIGKVSHQFRVNGCSTVIIVTPVEYHQKDTLILIPKDPLQDTFDIDKMEVSFNYHPLRMPQPKGCDNGIPVEITNLEKVKK